MLAKLKYSKYFTSQYYHIELCSEKRHKSAFTTIFGKFEFLRMPFGLAQGPAYFTLLIQKVLGSFSDLLFPYGSCVSTQFC